MIDRFRLVFVHRGQELRRIIDNGATHGPDVFIEVHVRGFFTSHQRLHHGAALREEERIVVYRKLIGDLLKVEVDVENGDTRHVVSELISTIFDIDNMLYFVAPEWWQPRVYKRHQSLGTGEGQFGQEPVERLTEEHVVGWGGIGEGRDANLVCDPSASYCLWCT